MVSQITKIFTVLSSSLHCKHKIFRSLNPAIAFLQLKSNNISTTKIVFTQLCIKII